MVTRRSRSTLSATASASWCFEVMAFTTPEGMCVRTNSVKTGSFSQALSSPEHPEISDSGSDGAARGAARLLGTAARGFDSTRLSCKWE
jgi:hypothetical protein